MFGSSSDILLCYVSEAYRTQDQRSQRPQVSCMIKWTRYRAILESCIITFLSAHLYHKTGGEGSLLKSNDGGKKTWVLFLDELDMWIQVKMDCCHITAHSGATLRDSRKGKFSQWAELQVSVCVWKTAAWDWNIYVCGTAKYLANCHEQDWKIWDKEIWERGMQLVILEEQKQWKSLLHVYPREHAPLNRGQVHH